METGIDDYLIFKKSVEKFYQRFNESIMYRIRLLKSYNFDFEKNEYIFLKSKENYFPNKVEKNEIILDTSGTECPIPVLKARNLCQTLSSGAIVKVICTDPLAEEDFRHYCKQSNYSLIDIIKSESKIYIKFKI